MPAERYGFEVSAWVGPEYYAELRADVNRAIEKAKAAERERCAKIAEGWHPMLYAPELPEGNHPRDAAYRDAKAAIARAIRGES